jgi:tetratricopeptide (TPR) repeat protein
MLLSALISFNFFSRMKPYSYSNELLDVLHHPLSWNTHVALARALWQNGTKNQGIQELLLAHELFSGSVLGAATDPSNMLLAWQNEPVRRHQQEEYWKQVLTSHPDYRDAYIQLAALSYQEGNLTQTHAYLTQAQSLDPNNTTVNRLTDFTSKLLE